jgi:nicotinate-nucleotide adenylyltransferase
MDLDDPISRLRDRSSLRLGIMGGAFDPIHIGHLVAADEALVQFGLDTVVFMPGGNPPHKARELAPVEFRYLLVAAATASHPKFLVSRYEIDRGQLCYTVETLEYLADLLPTDAAVFFVTGADAVLDILTWKDPARVLELCTLIAATRPGYDLSRLAAVLDQIGPGLARSGPQARVRIMEIPALAISSSLIRERLALGRGVRYLVPDSVAQLIEKAGAYPVRDLGPGSSLTSPCRP